LLIGLRAACATRASPQAAARSGCSSCVAGSGVIELSLGRIPRQGRVIVAALAGPGGAEVWRAQLALLCVRIGVVCVAADHA
jgi:hypothetical protein